MQVLSAHYEARWSQQDHFTWFLIGLLPPVWTHAPLWSCASWPSGFCCYLIDKDGQSSWMARAGLSNSTKLEKGRNISFLYWPNEPQVRQMKQKRMKHRGDRLGSWSLLQLAGLTTIFLCCRGTITETYSSITVLPSSPISSISSSDICFILTGAPLGHSPLRLAGPLLSSFSKLFLAQHYRNPFAFPSPPVFCS